MDQDASSSRVPSLLAIDIQPLHPELGKSLPWPAPMSSGAAGFDIAAAVDAPVLLEPGDWRLIGCGFALGLPPGYEAQIRPRSGLALKHGITCLNSPGTLDSDYRGEVGVILINLGREPFHVSPGLRLAQMVFAAVPAVHLQVVTQLQPSLRNTDGFGSTG